MKVKRFHLRLLAGAATGIAGLAAFGAAHALVIVPIWVPLLAGIPFSIVVGILIAWTFYELRSAGSLERPFRSGLLLGMVLWVSLIPMTMLDVLLRLSGNHATSGLAETLEITADLGLAFGAGWLGGWILSRRWRPALAMGIAALSSALAAGGPIAITKNLRSGLLFASLLGVFLVVGVVLAETDSRLAAWYAARQMPEGDAHNEQPEMSPSSSDRPEVQASPNS
jgi:hypothetical protein